MKISVISILVLFCSNAISAGLSASFTGTKFDNLTRNSTIFESDGTIDPSTVDLVDVSGENRSTNSEDASVWYSLTRVSVTTNTHKSPINTLTADTLSEDGTAAATHYAWSSNVAYAVGSTYTYSMYVMPINRTWIRLTWANSAPSVYFNLVGSGIVGTVTGGAGLAEIVSYNIQKITTGWYRVSMTWIGTGAAGGAAPGPTVFIAEADNDVTFDGLNQPSIVVWGAQVVRNDDFLQGPGLYHPTDAVAKSRWDMTDSANPPTQSDINLQGLDGNLVKANRFNGTDNYFSMPYHASTDIFDSDFTATFVISRRTGAVGSDYVFSKGVSGAGACGIEFYTTTSSFNVFFRGGAGVLVNGPNLVSIGNDIPKIVQVDRRGNYAQVCIDGFCGERSNVSGFGTDCNATVYVGASIVPDSFFDGKISYIRIDKESIDVTEREYQKEVLHGILGQNSKNIYAYSSENVLLDSDMEAVGTASWGSVNGPTKSKEAGAAFTGKGVQVLRVARNVTANPGVSQGVLDLSKGYKVDGYVRSDGNCIPQIALGATTNVVFTGTNSTDWQHASYDGSTVSSTFYLISSNTLAGQYCEWDEVYVYEYDMAWKLTRGSSAVKEFSNHKLAYAENGTGEPQPRIGGDGGGIEIEQQVQNKCLQSAAFGTTWTPVALTSTSSNASEDPFGTTTADGMVGTAVDTQHGYTQNVTLSATRWTFSVYAKRGDRNWVYLSDDTVVNAYAYFDVLNGKVGTVGAGTTYAKITPSYCTTTGDCYWRISISYTGTAALHTHAIYTADADGDNTVTGDAATVNTWLFGAQVEQLPVPSSYIATTTALVTRNADAINLDANSTNSTNIILPDSICSTCLSSKITMQFDAKCRYSSSTEISSPVTTTSLLEVSGTDSGTNRLTISITNTGVVGSYLYDNASTTHSSVTAANPVPFNNWFNIKAMFDLSDLTRMYMMVSGYTGAYTLVGNSGTATFDTSSTKIRLLQIYSNGAPIGACWIRNLRIQPSEF